jgi:hypothetical protein
MSGKRSITVATYTVGQTVLVDPDVYYNDYPSTGEVVAIVTKVREDEPDVIDLAVLGCEYTYRHRVTLDGTAVRNV